MKQSVYKNFLAKIEQGKQINEILKRKKDLCSYATYCKEIAVQNVDISPLQMTNCKS